MNKVILSVAAATTLALAAASANAAAKTGFYVGAQAGYGYSDLESISGNVEILNLLTGTVSTNKGGFDGRAYFGYRINQYVGAELGGEYLPQSNYKINFTGEDAGTNGTLTLRQYAFDLLVKGYLPFNQFFVVAGVGPTYVINKNELSGTLDGVSGSVSNSYEGFVRPKVVAGLGYNITPCTAVSVNYGHIFGNKSGSDLLNGERGVVDINTFTAGIEYTF